jgi:hypothetical protein
MKNGAESSTWIEATSVPSTCSICEKREKLVVVKLMGEVIMEEDVAALEKAGELVEVEEAVLPEGEAITEVNEVVMVKSERGRMEEIIIEQMHPQRLAVQRNSKQRSRQNEASSELALLHSLYYRYLFSID